MPNAKDFAKGKPFIIALNELSVDSCLYNLLSVIVEADFLNQRFPSELYFYKMEFSNYQSYREIIITPSRWIKSLPKDCAGFLRLDAMLFLCMGNIMNDTLFFDSGTKTEFTISNIRSPKFDSLDAKNDWYDWEKSPNAIVVKYSVCSGPPIDLYINVGKNLDGIVPPPQVGAGMPYHWRRSSKQLAPASRPVLVHYLIYNSGN